MIRRLLLNQKNPERIAVIEDDNALSYRELLQTAMALKPLLPEKRENIAILLPDGGHYIAAFWGIIMAGQTAFPLNILTTGHEIAPLLTQADIGTVITLAKYQALFTEIMALSQTALNVICIDELAPEDLDKESAAAVDIDPGLPMVLLNTSGTMGMRKIVQLSERNLENTVLGYSNRMYFDKQDIRVILAVPFSSVYALMLLSVCLLHSFPVILLGCPFTLDAFFHAAEKHRATHYEGSASAILLLTQIAGRHVPYDLSAFRYLGFGGSMVSGATIEKAYLAYPGIEFFQGYGMTESASLIAKHPLGPLVKTNSVGSAINGVEIAVEDDGKITSAPYINGEIVVKGPNIMLGYYKNEEATRETLKQGYLHTGDMGYLDDEGYLYICGRKKNVIIVRGFNVHPEEVEECLRHSSLARDCYVYGQKDSFGNEIVCVDIVPADESVTEETIRIYCGEHLAVYKQPQKIYLCAEIAKNAAGKTDRTGGGEAKVHKP